MKKKDLKGFINPKEIKTERLLLRKIKKSDLEDVYEYARDPMVSEFLLWNPHPDKAYTKAYLNIVEKKYRLGEFYDYAIEFEGKMIGTVGFTSFSVENNRAEIGFVLNSKYWGRGFAKEAVEKIIELGFTELNLNRIEARYMSENQRSRNLCDSIGMTFEGVQRNLIYSKGKYRDIGIMSILKEEYFNNIKSSLCDLK